MKELCIIHRMQFGYHTDIYKWCQYLRKDYRITVLTFDYGKEKIMLDGVSSRYVRLGNCRILNGIRFILCSILLLSTFKGIIIVSYFDGCKVIKIALPWKKMILDIRTFCIFPDENLRKKKDAELFKTAMRYDYVSVISEGLKAKLHLKNESVFVLPLGADPIYCNGKSFDELKLLYVGTFFNRNIEKTIEGFAKAVQLLKNATLTYVIIGDGPEKKSLKELAHRLGVGDRIEFVGYVPHENLFPYLQQTNVGVSFIPMSKYYDLQPPTKTFEYALAGLYVIATATSSNKEVIKAENGILISDTPEDFTNAIIQIYEKRNFLSSYDIQSSMLNYTWQTIVETKLKPFLDRI